MTNALTHWNDENTPIISIEKTQQRTIAAYWGAIIPAIPDLISKEQDRSQMTYETALKQLLQQQRQWIQQLHGDSQNTLSLRIISTGDKNSELQLGLVGKTEGVTEEDVQVNSRNFYNKIRDTFPNGYPLNPCESLAELAQLRLPFMPHETGEMGEFRRVINKLSTISNSDFQEATGLQINPWQPLESNFQDLFRACISHPAPVAIAINIRPTQLTDIEAQEMALVADSYARAASSSQNESQQLRMLSSGEQFQKKLLEAEQAAKVWGELQQSWLTCYEMTVSILSQISLPQSIIATLQASINGKREQDLNIKVTGQGKIILAKNNIQQIVLYQNWVDLTLHRWANDEELGKKLSRLLWLFSPLEVHCLFRLPIADSKGTWGLPSVAGAQDSRQLESDKVTGGEIKIGELNLTKKQLTQHLLICGVPGSGKTNTSLYLLETLWREHRIPWMVLEPAKTEYRGLKALESLKDDLLIFSLGDERVSPFRFNPFELPETINLDSHLGALLDLFSVSMSMWGPLPNVVEQLIIEAYKRKGFSSLGNNNNLLPPTFGDLAVLISEIVPKLGYSQESTDEILAAISVRINKFRRGALGKMLNTQTSIPFDVLMQRPVILEMSQITNSDDRAFVMGLILNRCYQYWIVRRHEATGELKHLLLVEEAHNLLGDVPESGNKEQANPKGKAVKNFANMLAEVRGFGQGIAIAEQNPQGLVPDVMVNTNIKLAHRVVEAKNREVLKQGMLLTSQEEKSLASLKVGQFFYYIGGEVEPSRTRSPNFKDDSKNGFNPRLLDSEINTISQAFREQYAEIYAPPFGCSQDAKFTFCIDIAIDIVQVIVDDVRFKEEKNQLFLKLLAMVFGANLLPEIHQLLGDLLIQQGVNHLSSQEVKTILQNATSLLALEAVKEKGKVHGWLGKDIKKAHKLLVTSILDYDQSLIDLWLNLCRIPDHLLALGLPHPFYQNSTVPGVFRYENQIILINRDEFADILIESSDDETAADILDNWLSQQVPFLWDNLSNEVQTSMRVDAAIQLASKTAPEMLESFL